MSGDGPSSTAKLAAETARVTRIRLDASAGKSKKTTSPDRAA
jgi:hypothetical protein